jgi:CRISPR/Cas system Type II protein with McrA/HNH and RuvC-like nuclease domain
MKKILGLDIGTTSIGWAIVEATDEKNINDVIGKSAETDINNQRLRIHEDAVGVRIIAQDTERFDKGLTLNDPKGSTLTPTANRRKYRGSRRMKSRYKLRRDKLGRVLDFINMTPDTAYYTNEKGKRGANNDIGKAIYKLRDNAVKGFISLNELGRILSHLNQWRGYSSDRFAKDEKPKFDYFVAEILEIDDLNKVAFTDELNKQEIKYYKIPIKIRFDEPYNLGDDENKNIVTQLIGFTFKKEIDFKNGDFVTIKKPEFKQDKKGKTILGEYYKITFTDPDPTDWNYKYQTLQKTLTEWCESGNTVGSYFYHNFYETQVIQRIRNQVVNRKWYEDEFDKIWELQFEYHKDILEKLNIEAIVKVAFKDFQPILNEILKKEGIKERLKCLIKDKIIFFQRPWQQAKNKGQCPFEKIKVKKETTVKGTGKKELIEEHVGRTVIPRSHPLFQEFKIWQQINNVRVYLKIRDEKIDLFASEKDFEKYIGQKISIVKERLYDSLQKSKTLSWRSFAETELQLKNKKEIIDIETGEVIKCGFEYNFRKLKRDKITYEDIKLKGNNTKVSLQNILVDKTENWFYKTHSDKQKITNLQLLWELIYDITNGDATKVATIIENHFSFDKDICFQLANLKFDDAGMGNLSAKAIRQILPLMSDGKNIPDKTLEKINSLLKLNNSVEETSKGKDEKLESLKDFIPDKKARLRLSKFSNTNDFTYLNYWEATAVRYGSHSTKKGAAIGNMKRVENHSMNNPIVEKIVNEAISMVNEIYNVYGFDEVRIELSRELKASMDERQQMWEAMNSNATKNDWAKQMLRELKKDFAELDTEPSTNSNLDKIKIIEDVVKFRNSEEFKLKTKEYKLSEPSKAEVRKYLMWLEQNFRCPYTNQPIPFTDVFAKGKVVEIEHIIPRERYFLNSYANKVITWREVNQAKADYGNRTAYEFIVSKRKEGTIRLGNGKEVNLVSKEDWESHVRLMFPKGGKQTNLLRKEIPEDPINRTLNETQYINKKLKEKLSELVGQQKVWVTSGAVTDILRDRWHLNDIMKELMRNRFENFEIPTGKKSFKLKTLAEQEIMFGNIQNVLNNSENFEVYKIPTGKKFIEIKDIDELKKIQGELDALIKENSISINPKIKSYDYSTSEEAFETKSLTYYTKQFDNKTGNYIDKEIFEGYSKRLDHRHHAIDAIIIACTKQNHIQYINTLNAISSADQESDESKKAKYNLLKADVCIGNSSKRFKTPWDENQFIPAIKAAMNGIAISHKNTRLLISPSKHSVDKNIKPNKIASIRGELHNETNYARKNYFEGDKTEITKLIPLIFKKKQENQSQAMVHLKSFVEIIKETVLKEKFQEILISLFEKYEELQLNDKSNRELSKEVLIEIKSRKLFFATTTNEPLTWLSTYSGKDKSSRPLGLSMNLNDPKEVNSIADPRIRRLAGYRLRYVSEQKAAIDKLEKDTSEKNKLKREVEALKLYSNAIYEVRIKKNDNSFAWIELSNFNTTDFDKINYANSETTIRIKEILTKLNLSDLKRTYLPHPIFLSDRPIEVKKVRQKAFNNDLYEITKGRYVFSRDVFMSYFFTEENEKRKDAKRSIEFLKLLDAVRIVSFDKPVKINYSKLVSKPECKLIFTLAKNDLVYLPEYKLTNEQIEEINWSNKQDIMPHLYIVKDMNPSRNEIVFQQFYKSDSIKISEASSKSLFKNPELKEQIEAIKYGDTKMWQHCIKVFTDKLGKKIVPYWEFPNGCWDKETAIKLELTL